MQIKLEDLTGKIEKQHYLKHLRTVKYSEVSRSKTKLQSYARQMMEEVKTAFKQKALVQTQLAITGQRPVTFALETNIINLPYANYKKISNFFETGKSYPVQLYFETISEYVNVSHFRIDLLASEDEVIHQTEQVIAKLAQAMQEKIKVVRTYQKSAPKKGSKKRASRRSTRRRKSKRK